METLITTATVQGNSSLVIAKTPFRAGDIVEIIVKHKSDSQKQNKYPLGGQPLIYQEPTESVADSEWEALQ